MDKEDKSNLITLQKPDQKSDINDALDDLPSLDLDDFQFSEDSLDFESEPVLASQKGISEKSHDEDELFQDLELLDNLQIMEEIHPSEIDVTRSGQSTIPSATMLSFVPHDDYLIKKAPHANHDSAADKNLFLDEKDNQDADPMEPDQVHGMQNEQSTLDLDSDDLFAEPLFLDEEEEEPALSNSKKVDLDTIPDAKSLDDLDEIPENIKLAEENELVIEDTGGEITPVTPLANQDNLPLAEDGSDTSQIPAAEDSSGFFDDVDEDEMIALSEDELGHILDEVVEEELQSPDIDSMEESAPDFPSKQESDDAQGGEDGSGGFFEDDDEDEAITLSEDELGEILGESAEIPETPGEKPQEIAQGGFFEDDGDEDDSITLSADELGEILDSNETTVSEADHGSEESSFKEDGDEILDDETVTLDINNLDLDMDEDSAGEEIPGEDPSVVDDLDGEEEEESLTFDLDSLDLGQDLDMAEDAAVEKLEKEADPLESLDQAAGTPDLDKDLALDSGDAPDDDESMTLDMDSLDINLDEDGEEIEPVSLEDDDDFGFIPQPPEEEILDDSFEENPLEYESTVLELDDGESDDLDDSEVDEGDEIFSRIDADQDQEDDVSIEEESLGLDLDSLDLNDDLIADDFDINEISKQKETSEWEELQGSKKSDFDSLDLESDLSPGEYLAEGNLDWMNPQVSPPLKEQILKEHPMPSQPEDDLNLGEDFEIEDVEIPSEEKGGTPVSFEDKVLFLEEDIPQPDLADQILSEADDELRPLPGKQRAFSDEEDIILDDEIFPAAVDTPSRRSSDILAPSLEKTTGLIDQEEKYAEAFEKAPLAMPTDHEALTGKQVAPSRDELKKMISYLDGLFENLPDDVVKKFARSEYFDLYISILKKLEIG